MRSLWRTWLRGRSVYTVSQKTVLTDVSFSTVYVATSQVQNNLVEENPDFQEERTAFLFPPVKGCCLLARGMQESHIVLYWCWDSTAQEDKTSDIRGAELSTEVKLDPEAAKSHWKKPENLLGLAGKPSADLGVPMTGPGSTGPAPPPLGKGGKGGKANGKHSRKGKGKGETQQEGKGGEVPRPKKTPEKEAKDETRLNQKQGCKMSSSHIKSCILEIFGPWGHEVRCRMHLANQELGPLACRCRHAGILHCRVPARNDFPEDLTRKHTYNIYIYILYTHTYIYIPDYIIHTYICIYSFFKCIYICACV